MQTPTPDLRFAIIAADIAIFTVHSGKLFVRIITVHADHPFFANRKALPGGLIRPEETAEVAAERIAMEKTGLHDIPFVQQIATFSSVDRDPRGRVVAIGYIALTPWDSLSSELQEADWAEARHLQGLAYDHDDILSHALSHLRHIVRTTTALRYLLPTEFTLTELEHTFGLTTGAPVDRRNFQKKVLKLDILTPLESHRASGPMRPARLYRFKGSGIQEIDTI